MTDKVTPNDEFDLEYEETVEKVQPPKTEEELPEKYRGKSIVDVVTMHQNAEKRLSQLGNEVGQLRKLTDQVLELKKENVVREPETRTPVTVDEIFADPDQAIRKTVESSDVARKADSASTRVDNLEKALALKEFTAKHPTYAEDIGDSTFQSWVSSNPARVELFRRADNYDPLSADALWQMWDEYKDLKSVAEKRDEAKARRTNAVKATRTVSDSTSDVEARSPVYSRAKLMELQTKAHQGDFTARNKLNDPGFQAEMQKAYSEGRVR